MFYVNMQFDFDDFANPTSYYVDNTYYDLDVDRRISQDWFLRYTDIEYADDYVQIGQQFNNYTFSHAVTETTVNARLGPDEALV